MDTNIKTCGICTKEINLKVDSYCHLIDYNKGKFHMEGFYHIQCYQDKIKGDKDIKKMAFGLFKRTNKLLNKAEGKEEEVYEI